MRQKSLPDELTVRHKIAEKQRELKLLRSIEKALAKHRSELELAKLVQESAKDSGGTK